MAESIRLAKYLAEQLSCSRREAEQYIEGGWVQVDGSVVEEPGFRVERQKVALLPGAILDEIAPITILMHWPTSHGPAPDASSIAHWMTPETRASDDRSGQRFLKRHLKDLTPTETLEPNASGLLVFTQDWRIARKLVDDRAKIEQEYIVEVEGQIAAGGLELLKHGLTFNRKPLPPLKVSWQNETHLRFALKAPQKGQIAYMCEAVGLKVKALKRIRLGRLPMAGLPAEKWRYLLRYEQF